MKQDACEECVSVQKALTLLTLKLVIIQRGRILFNLFSNAFLQSLGNILGQTSWKWNKSCVARIGIIN